MMGAWEWFYSAKTEVAAADRERYSYGLKAFQAELNSLGATLVVDGIWGPKTERAVNLFQIRHGLKADSSIGPRTAKSLFHPRIMALQGKYQIAKDLLCGLARHESAYDPVATGWSDPDDRGIIQYNSRFHEAITDKRAFDPAFILDYGAKELKTQHDRYLKANPDQKKRAWRCAVAHHNHPLGADTWFKGGKEAVLRLDNGQAIWNRVQNYSIHVELGC